MTIAARGILTALAFASVLLVGGCRKPHAKVPAEYQGSETVVVENLAAGDVCDFRMYTRDQHGVFTARNWLDGSIGKGDRLQIKVKPGAYTVSVVGCNTAFSGAQDVVIEGPTTVGIGNQPKAGVGTAVMVRVNKASLMNGGTGGGGAGGGADSCTGLCGGVHGNCCPDEGWHCVIDPKDARELGDQATGTCTLK